jgi:L-alanine-DL-glutamate epimerase-like enolase superfamily enzyme
MTEIRDVTVEPLDLPLTEPFEISLGTQHEASNVLVTVETEAATGYGEGSPLPPVTGETRSAALATAEAMADLVVGKDVADYRHLAREVRSTFPGMVSAAFAVETAILDAYCRERDLPLAELFGGSPGTAETDLTIPIVPPDSAAENAARAVDDGFEHLKIKTGSDLDADVERVVAVRKAAPDAALKIDANQGWTPKETAAFADRVAECGIRLELIEQPVPADDAVGLARTRERVDVPIAADETVFTPTDAVEVVRGDAADVINVKLGKSGPLATADIVSIAEAANLELMVGCMLESAVGIHTSAHVVAGLGSFEYVDLDGNLLLAEDVTDIEYGPSLELSGPGHGITPNG